MALFKPGEAGMRDPLDNSLQNGRIMNPPRFAQVGKLNGPSKGTKRNKMVIEGPGAVTSVKKGR